MTGAVQPVAQCLAGLRVAFRQPHAQFGVVEPDGFLCQRKRPLIWVHPGQTTGANLMGGEVAGRAHISYCPASASGSIHPPTSPANFSRLVTERKPVELR